jgi:hypothetical protein
MNVVAALIADMVRAGVDPDLIGRTAEALADAAASAPKAKSAGAVRQERYRRNKASLVTESDVCDAPLSPSLDKEASPTPPEEIKLSPLTPRTTLPNGHANDLEALTSKLLEAVGDGNIQPHGALNLSAILGLIEAGVDLETDILPTIRAKAAKLKRPAGSWAYFAEAIRDAHASRIEAGKGVVAPKPFDDSDERWVKRLKLSRERRQWSFAEYGPAPGQPGCRVPRHLLEPSDGVGWRAWDAAA